MKNRNTHKTTKLALCAGATALAAFVPHAHAQSMDDGLINKLEQKGILTADEARDLRADSAASQTNMLNQMPASKWKIADSIKSIGLYGDVRFRYEYRGVDNPTPGSNTKTGVTGDTYSRERFRYALRIGLRGDLYDDFSYGIRLETGSNARSPWDTFGNNGNSGQVTPSDKSNSGIYLGQAYLNWHPADWYEMTVGRMPMPLYTTPMVWDSDIQPEGAFEKFKYTIDDVDLFADFGQFDYQDPTATTMAPSGDTFLLAWQAGGKVNISKDMFFKAAPIFYTYTGTGTSTGVDGLNSKFVGQGNASGLNQVGGNYVYNQVGLNNLFILEIPAEFDFKINHTPLGPLQARLFGDFAYNFQGNARADAAYHAAPAAFPSGGPTTGQNIAYQAGFGIGSAGPTYGPIQGLVYGSTSKKNTWEARMYWQYVEQYALDVNLIDSDFFEGRGNLEGIYTAFAYSFTDAIIGTIRYGYATPIDNNLGTGGSNLDIPSINQIRNYNLVQMDLTWRF